MAPEPAAARPTGALLVVGSASGVGKSTVTAGICRSYARRGVRVAPFKAQNMSNHAAVTADGGEVGRAQAVQAAAAGVDIERRMNPILLKPSAGNRSHVVVMGDEVGTTDARAYGPTTAQLKATVLDAFTSLRRDFPVVIGEGAGGAAEINLLARDLVNLPLASAAGVPSLLVVDIERGGAFAAAHGTIDLLPPVLRSTIKGIVFNSFRGDPRLLDNGIAELEARTDVPFLGVLGHLGDEPLLGEEDSLDFGWQSRRAHRSTTPVRIAAVRLPHLANPSDLDPFMHEPDVQFRWISHASETAATDLIVIPGSRATVHDLAWLRQTGLADAVASSTASVVGLCAGYQMLGTTITDTVESTAGTVDGLGLLDAITVFAEPKIVRRRRGQVASTPAACDVEGYEIRFGRPEANGANWLTIDGESEGCVSGEGRVHGTSLHGVFDGDDMRAGFLADVAHRHGRTYAPAPEPFAAVWQRQHDKLADWVDESIGTSALEALVGSAVAAGTEPGWPDLGAAR